MKHPFTRRGSLPFDPGRGPTSRTVWTARLRTTGWLWRRCAGRWADWSRCRCSPCSRCRRRRGETKKAVSKSLCQMLLVGGRPEIVREGFRGCWCHPGLRRATKRADGLRQEWVGLLWLLGWRKNCRKTAKNGRRPAKIHSLSKFIL